MMRISLAVAIIWILDVSSGANTRVPRYSWSCNNITRLCEKSSHYQIKDDYLNHKMCRLTCGNDGNLWPKPTTTTLISKELIAFHPSAIKFEADASDKKYLEHLQKIEEIFLANVYRECGNCSMHNNNEVIVRIISHSVNTDLYFGVDESYLVTIKQDGNKILVKIVCETIYGARHGLETLSQLMVNNKLEPDQQNKDVMLVTSRNVTIIDRPVYLHRGLLIDTGRNYLPIATIKRQLDAMAHSKMNILHWHATDSQSFPLQLRHVAILAKYGAYSQDQVYTTSDIENLLTYAKYRGIRVILEVDTPAHAGNGWQWGPSNNLGKLAVCVNKTPWRNYCIQPPCGQLNPVNENVYIVLEQLYSDIVQLFPEGEMFHMGGDEVFLPCWNSSIEIIEYLERHGKGRMVDDFLWLWGQFQEKAARAYNTKSPQSKIILWSSALTDPNIISTYLNKDRYIIQTWVGAEDSLPTQLLNLGYKLIMSTKNAWYLDHGFWGATSYYPWRTVYKNELPNHPNVLGGEICMWGELVDDSTIDPRVWPRAAAAAERLWSDPEGSAALAEPRFYEHRDRLVSLGIRAEALAPEWCLQNDGQCL